jgi:hypothetical protein
MQERAQCPLLVFVFLFDLFLPALSPFSPHFSHRVGPFQHRPGLSASAQCRCLDASAYEETGSFSSATPNPLCCR